MYELNRRAASLCRSVIDDAQVLNVELTSCPSGATILDFGVNARGGISAGRKLAEICMAGLGVVQIVPSGSAAWSGPAVWVSTDHPVPACMASQYAGWQIQHPTFFAMGSGPKRAAKGQEELFRHIGHKESSDVAVGVLETANLPPAEVCETIAGDCQVAAENLYLAVAPTASVAGCTQIAARTVETALHKMHELGFDIHQVQHGCGVAPLPPVAKDDMAAIGRTNDAVLYGGQVTLWVQADDDALTELGPRIPSAASSDHGRPFAEVFASYDHDFYKIDPHLFSPAEITLININTGRVHRFGELRPDLVNASFST